MGTKRPLALDYASHGAAKGWRANEHLIDALPYVDHVPLELRTVVDSLIEEEKCKSIKLPSDYLRELPAVRAPQFEEHPVLKTEYERVRSKQPMQPLDTVRYRLEPPPQNKRGDVNAWRQALENAHSQLEHQHLRILNQELLLKHGDKSWRAQVQLNESTVKYLEQQVAAIKKETDQLNRERKLQQHAAGAELSKLERQYLSQVRKNWDIERACDRLETEVTNVEAELERRLQAVAAQDAQQAASEVTEAQANGTADFEAAANGTHDVGAATNGTDDGAGEVVEAAAPDEDVVIASAEEPGEGRVGPLESRAEPSQENNAYGAEAGIVQEAAESEATGIRPVERQSAEAEVVPEEQNGQ